MRAQIPGCLPHCLHYIHDLIEECLSLQHHLQRCDAVVQCYFVGDQLGEPLLILVQNVNYALPIVLYTIAVCGIPGSVHMKLTAHDLPVGFTGEGNVTSGISHQGDVSVLLQDAQAGLQTVGGTGSLNHQVNLAEMLLNVVNHVGLQCVEGMYIAHLLGECHLGRIDIPDHHVHGACILCQTGQDHTDGACSGDTHIVACLHAGHIQCMECHCQRLSHSCQYGGQGLGQEYQIPCGNSYVLSETTVTAGSEVVVALTYIVMAGCTLAAMSNSGSGNQGITVTMPVIAYSIRYGTDDERLARALVLSHLIAIHIKGYLGKLSALCGCVIASTGSSCGLVYLRGGDYDQICAAIKNMIGNITGMVCDGAKVGCAMKVASGVSSALQSAVLAREGICISEHDGIIEKDIEKTIRNLGKIGSVGMQHTDNMILDIMVCK